ncbi:MAG: N-acyl homoserine lactonase family protein [Bacteroidales bacterium]|nr:N-acyl homoserine lactonase family protein [Bacteroidales bacterium]
MPKAVLNGGRYTISNTLSPFVKKRNWQWVPVFCYLIEHPKGKVLVDTGWHRDMSPNGEYDKKAQRESLRSRLLFKACEGYVEEGQAIDEQLAAMGIKPEDLDYVLLTHLDAPAVNGLRALANAKEIFVSRDEYSVARRPKGLLNKIRYQTDWWEHVKIHVFDWNQTDGPVGKSFQLFGDDSITMIKTPGHSSGHCSVKIKNNHNEYVLLCGDTAYTAREWQTEKPAGIVADKILEKMSLDWIRQQSVSSYCIESIAGHDPTVRPHFIYL